MGTKIGMISTFLIIMVSLTGIAAADNINLLEPGKSTVVTDITVSSGSSGVIKDLKISGFNQNNGTTHTLTSVVVDSSSNPSADIIIKFHEKIAPCGPTSCSGFFAGPYKWVQSEPVGGSETLDISFEAASNAKGLYYVQITDNNGNPFTVSVTTTTTSIPEFPTVAVPMVAVIGLVFFFQHRRRKGE